MDNDELLVQVLSAINDGNAAMIKRMDAKFDAMDIKINELETRINVKIENEICGRMDALFDGYKLSHEQMFITNQRVDKLEVHVDNLEVRVNNLEAIAV